MTEQVQQEPEKLEEPTKTPKRKRKVVNLSAGVKEKTEMTQGQTEIKQIQVPDDIPPKMTAVEYDMVVREIINRQTIPAILKINQLPVEKATPEEKQKAIHKVMEDTINKAFQLAVVNEIILDIVQNNGFEELIYRSQFWLKKNKRGAFLKDLAKVFLRNALIDIVNTAFAKLMEQAALARAKAEAEAKEQKEEE